MKASKLVVPVLCALAGFALGMLFRTDSYLYRNESNGTYRVDRTTGVEMAATSSGWLPVGEPTTSSAVAASR